MTLPKLYVALIFLGLQFIHPAFAEIYKCKTANNQTIYSSKKCAETVEIFIPRFESVKITANNKAIEKDENKPSVDIYITRWCPYCKKAMAYLRSRNISFNAYDIEKDPQAKEKKLKLASNYSGVPLTVINGKILKGFSESRFELALAQ
jgi:glutaredoxin